MNVLWLAAYPHPLKFKMHPTPWLTALAELLVKEYNINLTVLTYNENIDKDEIFTYNNINFIILKVLKDKISLLQGYRDRIEKVATYIEKNKTRYDLVHVHGSEQLYQVIGAKLTIPKILSIQGIVNECVKILPITLDYRHLSWRVAAYYENKYLNYYSWFICRTNWDENYILHKVPNASIVKNWELMRKPFYEINKNNYSKSEQLVFAGGIDFTKGVREVLKSFEFLASISNFTLKIAGSGSEKKFMQIINSLKLSINIKSRIEYVGFLNAEELFELFSQSYCLIHPSYIDNSPNTICEAQLMGLPVVAANVGGVSSLIKHQETGLLTSHLPIEIAKSIMELKNNLKLYNNISKSSRSMALLRHDPNTILEKTIEIYHKVIGL